MRSLITASLLLTLVSITLASDADLTEWEQFKEEHDKVYATPEEEEARLKIFLEKKEAIRKHNELYEKGLSTYWMGTNHLSDMTHEEIRQQYGGSVRHAAPVRTPAPRQALKASLPSSVDWRTKHLVSEVKTQGGCGACWAFSSTGAMEGQIAKKTGKLYSLSEQQLIDCNPYNMGCANGGWMTTAYRYIKEAGGIETEQEYPFTGKDKQSCKFKKSLTKGTVKDIVDLPSGDENRLKQAVAEVGPIAAGMDSSYDTFDSYAGGIYNEPRCSNTSMDHGVLIVGYGSSGGNDYWLVKNSWGPKYGEKGYIRVARNKHNKCALATAANYPTV